MINKYKDDDTTEGINSSLLFYKAKCNKICNIIFRRNRHNECDLHINE